LGLVFLKALFYDRWVVYHWIEGQFLSASLDFIVLTRFLAFLLEPTLGLLGVQIEIAVAMCGGIRLLSTALVVQCLGAESAFFEFFLN
jgi:hypothetical protein